MFLLSDSLSCSPNICYCQGSLGIVLPFVNIKIHVQWLCDRMRNPGHVTSCQAVSPVVPAEGNQLSTSALQPQPLSKKAMGNLQAMVCCQVNHHPREQVTLCFCFFWSHTSAEKTAPIGPSRPSTIGYPAEFPRVYLDFFKHPNQNTWVSDRRGLEKCSSGW